MKPQKKLQGAAATAPQSELTRFKALWRDTFTEAQRDCWRSQFVSATPTRDTRESLRLKHGINLTEDDQLVRFRKWDAEEQTRADERERMLADEQFLEVTHPDWDADRLRQEVLNAAKRRSLATGDFALGLSAVKVDQAEQAARFNAQLETAKLELSRQIEARHAEEFRLELEKHQLETSTMLLDQALRAKADEINASHLSQAEKIAAMRRAAFADVDALQASGQLNLPKA